MSQLTTMRCLKCSFFLALLFAAICFWNLDSTWTARHTATPTEHRHTPLASHRLRDSDPRCLARDFQDTPRNLFLLPPGEYVATRRKEQQQQAKKDDPADILYNKNVVRVVEHPRSSNRSRHRSRDQQGEELPIAYVITPTHARHAQKADLLRLCYTLMHVPRVHWLVVEDSAQKTATVTEVIANCPGPSVTHLVANDVRKTAHRGVTQRNFALRWLRRCAMPSGSTGGVFFADDDNTYDLLLFEAVRWTKGVSVWPVGTVEDAMWVGPICLNDKVVGFEGLWGLWRKFPLDMASFSVGLNFLLTRPNAEFRPQWKVGHLETGFLESLSISMEDLTVEPDANCSQVLAWHTQTVKKNWKPPIKKKP